LHLRIWMVLFLFLRPGDPRKRVAGIEFTKTNLRFICIILAGNRMQLPIFFNEIVRYNTSSFVVSLYTVRDGLFAMYLHFKNMLGILGCCIKIYLYCIRFNIDRFPIWTWKILLKGWLVLNGIDPWPWISINFARMFFSLLFFLPNMSKRSIEKTTVLAPPF